MYDNKQTKVSIKYLGVLMDKNLTRRHQTDANATKISKNVGLIAKLHHYVPWKMLLNIYKSFTHPYLTCGLATWGQASKTYLNKINFQKRTLRLLLLISFF